jgi:hypothetical protein
MTGAVRQAKANGEDIPYDMHYCVFVPSAIANVFSFFHHTLPVTAITDLHQNRCDDSSTLDHREVRLSPETDASLVSNQVPAL